MGNKVTIKQAAEELGVSQQYVRIAMQRGLLPIGITQKLTGKRYSYLIVRGQLDEYLRKEGMKNE